jgi:serine/threonine-protein kinase
MITAGQVVGNYRVVKQLGEGGMGAVFEAVHKDIGKHAAIKVLHSQLSQNPQVATRFLNEARAASIIEHPGIVEIFEFGRIDDGTAYIVMEFLRGESLARRMERLGKELGNDAFRLTRQIASVLAAAHEKGIVHRDLKPDNVMIVPDPEAPGGERAKVLDFGIAKVAEEFQNPDVNLVKTQDGMLLGTPAYMSPEQCRGAKDVTDKSDVYSLGMMLYQMVAGMLPFEDSSLGEIMASHLYKEPPPLTQVEPTVTDGVAVLVQGMMAKRPADRPSMKEVVTRLWNLGAPQTLPLRAVSQAEVRPRTMLLNDANTALPTAKPMPQTAVVVGPTPTPWRAIVGVVALVAMIGAGVGFAVLRKPKKTIVGSGDARGGDRGTVVERHHDDRSTPPPGMAVIPTGTFHMGSTAEEVARTFDWCQTQMNGCKREFYEREQPLRAVRLSPFFLDTTEVTNEAFVKWLRKQSFTVEGDKVLDSGNLVANLHSAHGGIAWNPQTGFSVRARAARRPVVQVTWEVAQRYCTDQGKALPTEAQWELAARGSRGRRFPWGEAEPRCDAVVFGRDKGGVCASARADAEDVATAAADLSAEGVHDLGGNVAEWVRDAFVAPYPACGDCTDPVVEPAADSKLRVIRGGDWARPVESLRSAGRSRAARDSVQFNVGFRCARALEPDKRGEK